MNSFIELHDLIIDLLGHADFHVSPEMITPSARSGNNRIYRVDTAAGIFAVKQYFRHEGDSRDRLAAEYAFLTYANTVVPKSTPKSFACDTRSGLALYEFIEGQPFHPGDISVPQVNAAIRFFCALNAPSFRVIAQLPVASEACFSLREHLGVITGRIERLKGLVPSSDIDSEALGFFQELEKYWRHLTEEIYETAKDIQLDPNKELDLAQRCISPSDFGFHNALVEPSGNIRFLDFEYAGWDDPAKTMGDFFAQLAVPVPHEYFNQFVAECMAIFPEPESLIYRANLLCPVFKVKWCCIALNVFLAVHLARRKFANPSLDEFTLKINQLVKAKRIFQSIQEHPWPTLI
ncbi:MAG: phosphotransferase [Gammaproteobacteria bacterium]|nr:phosphotransferase [Gammaproteobacteria bacterium]